MKTTLFILLNLLIQSSLVVAQSLDCPADMLIGCHEEIDAQPTITNGSGYTLNTSKEFLESNCERTVVRVVFSLIDKSTGAVVDNCSHLVTQTPYIKPVQFPRDTTLYGLPISEVVHNTAYSDGLIPQGTNDCGVFYTFEDDVVELYPDAFVYRSWSAYNSCTDKTSIARQRILLSDLPNNTISTQVKDCLGTEIRIDDIKIFLNDEAVSIGDCFSPFDSLHQTLNCIVERHEFSQGDILRLELDGVYNPYLGLSLKDVIDIQRHILGLRRFEAPCRRAAADVNRDSRINGIDLVELRKLMLGIYTEWPYGDGPDIYINGDKREGMVLSMADFPLSQLEITIINQGNTSTID